MASNVDVSFAWLLADLVGAQARHPDERDRIESALQAARLPLTTVALAGCILARLPHDFERRWLTYHAHGYVLSVVVAALWLAQRAMDDSPYNLRSWIEVVANNAITRDMLHTTDAMMLEYVAQFLASKDDADKLPVTSTLRCYGTGTSARSRQPCRWCARPTARRALGLTSSM